MPYPSAPLFVRLLLFFLLFHLQLHLLLFDAFLLTLCGLLCSRLLHELLSQSMGFRWSGWVQQDPMTGDWPCWVGTANRFLIPTASGLFCSKAGPNYGSLSLPQKTAGCRGLPCLKSERSKINTSCSYPPLQYKMACVYHLAKKLCANKRRNGHVYRLNLPLGMLHAEIGLTGCGWMGFPKMGIPLNHPFFGDFHGFSIITWYISYNPCGKSMKIHIIHG